MGRALPSSQSLARLHPALRTLLPLLPILVFFVLVNEARVQAAHAVGDEGDYLTYARNITHGYFANRHSHSPVAYLWHGPGMPLLLIPFVKAGASLTLERLTQPVFLFLAALLLNRWTRVYTSERGALLATYAFALYFPLYDALGQIGSDALAVLMMVAVGYATTQLLRTGARRYGALAAGALAYLAMTRLEYGLVIELLLVGALIWFAVRRAQLQKRVLAVTAIALLLCVPWLAYTYHVSGRVSYWGNAGGLSLYWMGASRAPLVGDWHSVPDVATDRRLASYRPFFARLARKPPLEQDSALQHAAVKAIKADPKHYLKNVEANVSRLVFHTPYSFMPQHTSTSLYATPAAVLLTLVALTLAGLALGGVRPPREVLPVALLALVGFAVHVPVAAYSRFFLPVVPLLIWFVAVVLPPMVALRRRVRQPATA